MPFLFIFRSLRLNNGGRRGFGGVAVGFSTRLGSATLLPLLLAVDEEEDAPIPPELDR